MKLPAACAACGEQFLSVLRSDGRWTRSCSKRCDARVRAAARGTTVRARPPWYREAHREAVRRRHRQMKGGDVTAAYEADLRKRATICPLCGVALIRMPFQPRSAEVDHVIPLASGGRHVRANIRVICRECNNRPR